MMMAPRRPQRQSMLGTLVSPVEGTADSVDQSGHFEPSPQMSDEDLSAFAAGLDLDGGSRDEGRAEKITEAMLGGDGAPGIVEILAAINSGQVRTLAASDDGLFADGRTAFQVLQDVAACLSTMPVEADGAGIDLSCLLSSRDICVAEVEDSASWIIRVLGQGAAMLMQHGSASDAGPIGRSLAEFARCEDVIRLRSMWPGDEADVGAQLPPMHRIWIRVCPRESDLRKRKRASAGGDGGLVVDGLDELSEDTLSHEQSLYAPVLFYVIRLTGKARVLLLGSIGIPQNLGRCGMCGKACCEGTEFQDALVAVRMHHTLRRPQYFREIGGVDLEFQEMWTHSAKRDFAWCGVFDRVWNFGYSREQLTRIFSGMPPRLREATAALTSGVQRLIEMKKRNASNLRLLEDLRADVPIRDPVALQSLELSEQSETVASAFQDGAVIRTCYDEFGRRRGFQATSALAELLGCSSYDQVLSQLESCHLPIPATELETMGIFLYQLQMALSGRTRYSFYMRMFRYSDRRAVLVRVDQTANLEVRGIADPLNQMIFTPVSVAEFDFQLATNPCTARPFMHAIGDCRRGQELLDSAHSDIQLQTVANLRETPQGMQLLANFANLMERGI